MRCSDVQELLPRYHDHELSLPEHHAIRKHLHGCRACREVDALERALLDGCPALPMQIRECFFRELDQSLNEVLQDPVALRARRAAYGRRPGGSRRWASRLMVGASTTLLLSLAAHQTLKEPDELGALAAGPAPERGLRLQPLPGLALSSHNGPGPVRAASDLCQEAATYSSAVGWPMCRAGQWPVPLPAVSMLPSLISPPASFASIHFAPAPCASYRTSGPGLPCAP